MKFGKKLTGQQVPEWSSYYLNYKALKVEIRNIAKLTTEHGSLHDAAVQPAIAKFFFSLDKNLEKVDNFFNQRYLEYRKRLVRLESLSHESQDEELFGLLSELRASLRNLKWYAELNKRGFVKILKKLDKKTGSSQQLSYLNSHILPLSFANDSDISKDLTLVNSMLANITVKTASVVSEPCSYAEVIAQDNQSALEAKLLEEFQSVVLVSTSKYVSLLNTCCFHKSFQCIDWILDVIPTLGYAKDLSARNFFHHHVISLGKNGGDVESLKHILAKIPPHLKPSLVQKDAYKRTPLHYAAKYGLVSVCEVILESLEQWGVSLTEEIDAENLTPLHLAVIGGYPETVKALLHGKQGELHIDGPRLLELAVRTNNGELVKALLDAGSADVNTIDPETNETALYIATKLDCYQPAKVLLAAGAKHDVAESTHGWTPIFAAAYYGFDDLVDLLVQNGASYNTVDLAGWLPMEHAAFRGFIATADKLQCDSNYPVISAFDPTPEPVAKPHHYLKEHESLIIITLGSNYTLKDIAPVDLDMALDTSLSLVITHQGGESLTLDLPLDDYHEPIVFTTTKPNNNIVTFDIKSINGGEILGRAVALLDTLRVGVGSNRRSLYDTVTLPIMSSGSLNIMGTVNLEFLTIDAFNHPDSSKGRSATYWKNLMASRVVGHRGLGANKGNKRSLQLGENTMDSFKAAASLGASYVEFDVQLTKDHVPVVYHDFLVAETGADIPMHELTLEQFLHLNDVGPTTYQDDLYIDQKMSEVFKSRMKLTSTYKRLDYKANHRGYSIASPFATLEKMFKELPEHVGFNIECKYPVLYESEHESFGSVVVDLNFWCDTVLKMVMDLKGKRDVMFSSFCPDLCLALSLKQSTIPVLFLTESGTSEMADPRAMSLQGAIRFAKRWNLLGLVSVSDPLVKAPRLASVVKSNGLVCVTYGHLNNDPHCAAQQLSSGVDAVIVDDVAAVKRELVRRSSEENVIKTTPASLPVSA